jgi:hypothetical protein
MVNPELRFDLHVLQTLERLEIPYVVIGAFAGTSYGINRATYDVDIVVDLSEEHIEALTKAYPPPRYYADPYQMRESIIRDILTAVQIGLDPEITQEFNVHYIDRWAHAISTDVTDFWNKLKQAVQFKPFEDL